GSGTDTLWDIELLQFADTTIDLTANVLVYSGSFSGTGPGVLKASYATIAAALAAGGTLDGDTLVLKATTFNEASVSVNKGVTILGANHGLAGTDVLRGAESVITNGLMLTHSNIT